jgi:antagonist of KipI
MIRVKDPGFLTTVQDLGRYGFSHLGISPAGVADALSFRLANLLLGNDENAAALEMTLFGATLEFDEPTVIAVTGAECSIAVDGTEACHAQALSIASRSVVKCGRMMNGARAYLAFQGGLDVPLVMGSASTHLGAGFGGFEGRALRKGDVLRFGKRSARRSRVLPANKLPSMDLARPVTLRVTRGVQQDWFGSDAFAIFLSAEFSVTDQSGRTGLRLWGELIVPKNSSQLLTDGIPLGAVQIPKDGNPIILFVDQQTTGGYPKIANVIAADMHHVGQLRPRDRVRFGEVSVEEAVRLLRTQELWFKQILEGE